MRLLPALPLVIVIAVCSASASGGASHSKSRIAFVVNQNGWGEIWTMRTNGSDRRRLTARRRSRANSFGSQEPAWSPNGNQIVYVAGKHSDGHDFELYTMHPDGRGRHRLTFNWSPDYAPSWSPDGTTIAFVRWRTSGDSGAIFLMNSDGTNQREIAGEGQGIFLTGPAWSHDGKRIAYTRANLNEISGPEVAVYLMDANGENRQMLVDDAAQPAWSPDGSSIAFSTGRDKNGRCLFHDCAGYAPEIYVAASDGTNLRRVTRSSKTDMDPAWSPDSRRLLFARIATENSDYEIYSIRPDGSDLRRLTRNDVWDYQPAWQPR